MTAVLSSSNGRRISIGSGSLSPHPGSVDDSPKKTTDTTRARYLERKSASSALLISEAEKEAIRKETVGNFVSMTFSVHQHVEFHEGVFLCGSVRELGAWDSTQAVPLLWSAGDTWTTMVSLRRTDISTLEYKYLVKSSVSERWESGSNHVVLQQPAKEMLLRDFWEFPGYNHSS